MLSAGVRCILDVSLSYHDRILASSPDCIRLQQTLTSFNTFKTFSERMKIGGMFCTVCFLIIYISRTFADVTIMLRTWYKTTLIKILLKMNGLSAIITEFFLSESYLLHSHRPSTDIWVFSERDQKRSLTIKNIVVSDCYSIFSLDGVTNQKRITACYLTLN